MTYQVDERTSGDIFENAIRMFGIVAACEWFGHAPDSEFTKESTRVLEEREAVDKINRSTNHD